MKRKSGGVFIEHDVLNSKSFAALNKTAHRVFLRFYQKRRMSQVQVGKRKVWKNVNNGEIIFTYAEAESYGISKAAFSRAVGQLVEVGFLDIHEVGTGICGAPSKYGLSDRWKKFDRPDFETVSRIKRKSYTFPSKNP